MARPASSYRGARRNAAIHNPDPKARVRWDHFRLLNPSPWSPALLRPGRRNTLRGPDWRREEAARATAGGIIVSDD